MMTMGSGSGSAATRVEKATSHLLIGPDWALNMDICDMINIDRWQTKEVVKAIKKRLQNKHPKVQFLTLMLLETMMKNCGDPVRFEVAQHEVLQEMTKIVRKQTDFNVRDKALILLDSWQEAFGGPSSQFPQYYWAYIELKRTGVQFPRRLPDAPLTFINATSAPSNPNYQNNSLNYQNPNFQNERLPTETSNMSLTELNGIKSAMELLSEMLRAINPTDRIAIKDEIITDLVTQCRSNQKKIIQLVNSTGDEALLAEALALNDSLQNVIEKYESIASGSVPLQIEPSPVVTSASPVMTSSSPPVVVPAPVVEEKKKIKEEEEEDDEFAELARRKSKGKNIEQEAFSSSGVTTEESSSLSNKTIVPIDLSSPPKQQDMIDLLTLALYDPPQSSDSVTSSVSDSLAVVPVSSPVSPPGIQQQPYNYNNNPYNNNPYNGNNNNNVYNSNPYNGYVASWAQPAQPIQPPAQQQQYYNYPNNPYTSSYPNNNVQNNPYNPSYPNNNSQFQQYNSFPSNADPPQVNNNNNPMYSNPYSAPAQPMNRFDSFGNNNSVASVSHQMDRMGSFGGNSNIGMNSGGGGPALKKEMNNAPKPYYMPDNLFGDLIDLKSNKQTGTRSGQSMVNGKK